jgi:hypothetical protein
MLARIVGSAFLLHHHLQTRDGLHRIPLKCKLQGVRSQGSGLLMGVGGTSKSHDTLKWTQTDRTPAAEV